jgi:hypothetical protein
MKPCPRDKCKSKNSLIGDDKKQCDYCQSHDDGFLS